MNSPRAYFSLLTIGDAFVALGGVTAEGYIAEVEAYFNYTQTWLRQNSDLNLVTARSSFAALLLPSSPSTTTTTTTTTEASVVRLPASPSGSSGPSQTLSDFHSAFGSLPLQPPQFHDISNCLYKRKHRYMRNVKSYHSFSIL